MQPISFELGFYNQPKLVVLASYLPRVNDADPEWIVDALKGDNRLISRLLTVEPVWPGGSSDDIFSEINLMAVLEDLFTGRDYAETALMVSWFRKTLEVKFGSREVPRTKLDLRSQYFILRSRSSRATIMGGSIETVRQIYPRWSL